MEFKAKYFEELTAPELYSILRSRSAVFVVEQECVYQDVDGIDRDSLHVFAEEDGECTAYLRIYRISDDTVKIGRVLTLRRGCGLGREILKEGIRLAKERYSPSRIYVEAQCYAAGFYEKEGFRTCTDEFLEDGIPHVGMTLDL